MKSLFKKQQTPFVYHKYYLWAQHKWAEKMTSLTTGFSNSKIIFLLTLFTLISSSFFIYKIYTAISQSDVSKIKNAQTISKLKTNELKK